MLQVRRFRNQDGLIADMIYDINDGIDSRSSIVDMVDPSRKKAIPVDADAVDLLRPVVRSGKILAEPESLDTIRARVRTDLAGVHAGVRRFLNPHEYPVGLDIGLSESRARMISQQRSKSHAEAAR